MRKSMLWLTMWPVWASCGEETPRLSPTQHIDLVDTASTGRPLRPDSPNSDEIWTYGSDDDVTSHVSPAGDFRVHYATAGDHAVSTLDVDGSGVPDFVEEVAAAYDDVLATYLSLGFDAPLRDAFVAGDNGGDDLYDVYLLALPPSFTGRFRQEGCDASGACTGYIAQDNDFIGFGFPNTTYAIRLLAAHEFFHFVQAGYSGEQNSVYGEGSAVWASEAFDGDMQDLELFSPGFLSETQQALNVPFTGPVNPYSYGAAIFFRFLEEYTGDIGTVVDLVKETRPGSHGVAVPDWFDDALPYVLEQRGTDFATAFRDFAVWNLYTGPRADPSVSYANGAAYASVAFEDADLPFVDDSVRMFYASSRYYWSVPDGRSAITAALVRVNESSPEIDALRVFVATIQAGDVSSILALDPNEEPTTIDASGADAVVVVLVNTAAGGESPRPALCIGDAEEVASCRDELLGAPVLDGGEQPLDGGSDAGTGDDHIDGGTDDEPDVDDAAGCACRAQGPDVTMSVLFVLLLSRPARRRPRTLSVDAPDRESEDV